jgi:hypothetical protein
LDTQSLAAVPVAKDLFSTHWPIFGPGILSKQIFAEESGTLCAASVW